VDTRYTIEELVYRSCLALDDKDFKGLPESLRRRLSLHDHPRTARKIRKDMVWLDHDRKGMETLFSNLPRHKQRPLGR